MTRFAAVLVIPALALALIGCSNAAPDDPGGDGTTTIDSVTFEQYQAVPDFDDSEYLQTDAGALAELQALFDEHGVVPGETITTEQDECDGGLSTNLELEYSNGETVEMFIADCGLPEYDEFNAAANDLFTDWRKALGG
jgi:hypothetical protein